MIDDIVIDTALDVHLALPTQEDLPSLGANKVAYVMSRFPKLTETFILFEMVAMERFGVQVEVYPLLREKNTATKQEGGNLWVKILELFNRSQGKLKMHPEAVGFVNRAHFQPFFSWNIFAAQLYFLLRKPRAYLFTLWRLIRDTLGSLNYFMGALSSFPKIVFFAQQMAKDGITHVHAHFANHPAVAAFVIHRLTGIPYSFTAHGSDFQVDQHMLCRKIKEAAFVVTISNYNRDFIVSKCDQNHLPKIKVIHCGVDTKVFNPGEKGDDIEQASRTFTILCTGTMYEVKGHTYLVEACRILKESGLNFICLLVGDGPFRYTLIEQVEKSGLKDVVRFLGKRTRQELAQLLKKVDAVALPSIPTKSGRREGIPVVLMEAMASGVPVVASGISGIPELIDDGETGLLVPPRDPEALAVGLRRLYEDKVLSKRVGQMGREKILRDFDLYKNAALLASLINKVRVS